MTARKDAPPDTVALRLGDGLDDLPARRSGSSTEHGRRAQPQRGRGRGATTDTATPSTSPERPAPKAPTRGRRAAQKSPRPAAPKADEPAAAEDTPEGALPHLEGEDEAGEKRQQRTFNLPVSLIDRARGVAANAYWYGAPEGVETMADIARIALHRQISQWEKEYNDGTPFPLPLRGRLPTGPGPTGIARTHAGNRKSTPG